MKDYGVFGKYGFVVGTVIMHAAARVRLHWSTAQLIIMLPTTVLLMSFV